MILDNLVESTKKRYEERRKAVPLNVIKKQALAMNRKSPELYDLCGKKDFIYICECKKASPSKGIIEPDYHPDQQASLYVSAGCDCISCLTEPSRFLGSDEDLKKVIDVARGKALVLRKDFICSKYQIYESKVLGADVILLICAILDGNTLKEYLDLAHSLGLAALVETHSEKEVKKAVKAGARIIGVNNRNLKDFTMDSNLSLSMRQKHKDLFLISESGVKSPEDVKKIQKFGLNGVLIGEALMRSEDPVGFLEECRKCL